MVDCDLADFYAVEAKALNHAVTREETLSALLSTIRLMSSGYLCSRCAFPLVSSVLFPSLQSENGVSTSPLLLGWPHTTGPSMQNFV
jgi:hypothetical protein